MSPATVAETMMQSMIDLAQEKAAAGNYPEAVQTITTFIGSIEGQDAKVRKTFGMNLIPLYCLRAKVHVEVGNPGNDASRLQLAQEDVGKAEKALDEFYTGMDPAQKESARASIRNVIGADEKLRNESMSSILQLRNRFSPGGGKASRSGGANQARRAEVAGTVGAHGVFFAIGLVLWGLVVALGYGGSRIARSGSSLAWVLIIPCIVLFFVLFFASLRGWDWLADRGTAGERLKVVIVILLMMTMIGMIPIVYWTGKGAARWYYQRAGR